MNEICPLVHVSLSWHARFWQTLNCTCRKDLGPHVDICQVSLEGLIGFEGPSKWILVLPQHQGPSSSNGVSCLETPGVHMQCSIFVELPQATNGTPRCTNVMPSAVISWFMHVPVTEKNPPVIYVIDTLKNQPGIDLSKLVTNYSLNL